MKSMVLLAIKLILSLGTTLGSKKRLIDEYTISIADSSLAQDFIIRHHSQFSESTERNRQPSHQRKINGNRLKEYLGAEILGLLASGPIKIQICMIFWLINT